MPTPPCISVSSRRRKVGVAVADGSPLAPWAGKPAPEHGALLGIAPINRDSGTLRGRRTIAGGGASVRAAFYAATLVASRANPVIAAHYNKLRTAGKTAKQALVACMRRLLTILNAILRDRKPWQTA
jgi:transposase